MVKAEDPLRFLIYLKEIELNPTKCEIRIGGIYFVKPISYWDSVLVDVFV